MSSCLSGGSRTFVLDLDIVKSTSISNSTSSTTSSPSSTLSETRKPRTPRKRPNQIYNEAAVLLSSVYPTIFPTKPFPTNAATSLRNVPSLCFHDVSFGSSSELLLPCRVTDHFGFPVHSPPLPSYNRIQSFNKLLEKSSNSPRQVALGNCDDFFDQTSSILDEEMELVEGIDSIMGVAASPESQPSDSTNNTTGGGASGVPYGLGFAGRTMRRGVPALRQVDRGDWWRFPAIDMFQISPRLSNNNQDSQHKSSKKNIKKQELEPSETSLENIPNVTSSLMLKLNYKEVINAWSDRGLPFDEPNMFRPNAHAMLLAQIDSFREDGGMREASVIRYKEKRQTRLFSKKIIRYQVRKVNADCRPRMKGRFVRRPTIDRQQSRKKKLRNILSQQET